MEKKVKQANNLERYFQRSSTIEHDQYEEPSSSGLDSKPLQYRRRNQQPQADRSFRLHAGQVSGEDTVLQEDMACEREDTELQSPVGVSDSQACASAEHVLSGKVSNLNQWASLLTRGKFQSPKLVRGQYFLEFGQADFTHTTCKGCGLVYAKGHDEDDRVHSQFHQRQMQGIPFQGWKRERVIESLHPKGTRIVVVLPGDAPQHMRKAKEVMHLIEQELGLSSNWTWNSQCKVFLYISASKVVGCLIAEHIEQGFRVWPSLGSPRANAHKTSTLNDLGPNDSSMPAVSSPILLERGMASGGHDSAGSKGCCTGGRIWGSSKLERCNFNQTVGSGSTSSVATQNVEDSGSDAKENMWEAGCLRREGGEGTPSMSGLGDNRSETQVCKNGGSGLGRSRGNAMVFGGFTFRRESVKANDARDDRPYAAPSGIVRCERQAVPAVCGVRLVWVWPRERRKGVAVRLLDAMRHHFAFGYVIARSEIAFAQPTAAGISLAESYCKTQTFLVY